jgi:hypothetical protein
MKKGSIFNDAPLFSCASLKLPATVSRPTLPVLHFVAATFLKDFSRQKRPRAHRAKADTIAVGPESSRFNSLVDKKPEHMPMG